MEKLTPEERDALTESERAKYDEAIADLEKAEAEEAAAKAEAEKKAEIDAAVKQHLAEIEKQRQEEADEQARIEAEKKSRETPADVYEKLAQLQYEDPVAYQKEILKLATEQAERNVLAQADARYGGAARKVQATAVEDKLAEGLGEKGREYVRQYSHMISEENADDPKVKDLVRRAAKQYETENTVVREKVESTYGDPPVVKAEDRQAADMFAEIAARNSGVPLDKLKLTDAELRQSKEAAA